MKDSTVFESGMGELGLGIEGVLRRAARSLIEQAIETEPPRILRRLLFPREWSHDEQS
ncbi:hypothetical protein [Acidithiobacillus ferriphilus]|uniref:hypothetical protein n=1 Tax=Acidithiobacillus ferriphilus TaxID=1689834 RepID=UPI001C07A0EF|nr:hypothetical protein [Acidithiobacillus ferriphilus]MBU2855080.1 hypothetical protein [Acidithiobacillus ferriphilus]